MDALYSSPLYDLFRRGEAAPDIRMLAAQGVLAPRAHEQLALLVLLADDSAPAVREAARATIARIPEAALRRFLGRGDVPEAVLAFFAARGVEPAEAAPAADEAPLVADDAGEVEPAPEPLAADETTESAEARRMATVQRLSLLNVTGKVKAAMRGTREERSVLIRDPNKLVSLAVLSSPKITEQEIETITRMGAVSEEVLRVIGTSRAWVKNYGVIQGLCFNPKTPIALTLGFIKRLTERDVKHLATDRNIPEPLKLTARKILSAGQSRRS